MNALVEQVAAEKPFSILSGVLTMRGLTPGPDSVLSQASRHELLKLYPDAVAEPSEYRTPREVMRYRAAVSVYCLGWEYLALRGLEALSPAVSVVLRFREIRAGGSREQRAFVQLLVCGAAGPVAKRLSEVSHFLEAAGL